MSKAMVLDTYAMMCYLQKEPGALEVYQYLKQAQKGEITLFLNVVNLTEILYTVERRYDEAMANQFMTTLPALPIEMVNVDKSLAQMAAKIKATRAPIALGDCFCIATAMKYGAAILTGDSEFKKLEDQVEIVWLPPKS